MTTRASHQIRRNQDFQWVVTGLDTFGFVASHSRDSALFPHGDVKKVTVKYEPWSGDARDWLSLLKDRKRVFVRMNVYEHISVEGGYVNSLVVCDRQEFARQCLSELVSFGFEVFSCTTSICEDWEDDIDPEYRSPGLSDGHVPQGWACAFKGAGHNRLVSRRWLEYGPWRLIRDEESDLSFIQFHDLEADANIALEQAKPGHQRMGLTLEGGFISKTWLKPTRLPERGFYDADRMVIEYVITGTELETQAFYEATQARYHADQAFNVEVDNLAFVFMEEENAKAHLHELWLRELECWAIIDGEKVRLDDTYQPPPPTKPKWVLEAREVGQG